MSAGRRFEPPDGDLLPNAETALEAAALGEPGTTVAETSEPAREPGPPAPRRRGRPPGSKNRPKPMPAVVAADASRAVPGVPDLRAADAPPVTRAEIRRRSAAARRRDAGQPPVARGDRLTIEQIVACDSPREPRLSPDGRRVAYTAEAGGARQVCILDLRSGATRQLTASEKAVSDPQWAPDGAHLAFVRDDAIWLIGTDGSRPTVVTDHPAGSRAPRWAPDGRQIAFISRRRGWSQVWLQAAPLPHRGRPSRRPAFLEPRAITPAGVDVEDLAWSPDGARIALTAQRHPDLLTNQVTVLELASGEERIVAGEGHWATAARWLPDGSGLLLLSDADGWFQVARVAADGTSRTALTGGAVEHGAPGAGFGIAPIPSPDGTRFVHATVRDGLQQLHVAPMTGAAPAKRRPGRPRKHPVADLGPGTGGSLRIDPFDGVWLAVAWMPDGDSILAVGESSREPEDLWILPVPPPDGTATRRPRRLTQSRPAALPVGGFVDAEHRTVNARDGLAIPVTLWRPPAATGRRGGRTVPTIIHVHGGPTWQAFRDWVPFRDLLVQEGFAYLSVDFRGSTGYGRAYRHANRDEWGHADVHDVIDAARWAAAQAWSNGRLAMYGGSYGGYLTLCALVEEPSMWAAGVDLFGDSEIAESYRHGDRVGRIDLERMMGTPDDPSKVELYRRGSPLYRAERIEAPLLLLHGRKDRRVVPLMTEKMIEALEIEGKYHEVHWYADEGHGFDRRENRRDAFGRILAWLKRHLAGETPQPVA
ncbi:MAG TPA: prolyl oligopeptidase family serine peptidase [Candidatus Limnocylindrales bacterium]